MKIMILDDEFPVIRKIRNIIKECFSDQDELKIIHFIDIKEMLKHAIWFRDIDIACLDINLQCDGCNGIDAAKRLKIFNGHTLIIFITVHTDYYKELVNAEPFRFILKDELHKELPIALQDARRRLERCPNDFAYKFKRKEYKESMDDIMYFWSGEHRYVYMKLCDGTIKKFIAQMDELEEELRKLKYIFIRANKSYIVNPIYIEWENEEFLIISGLEIKKTLYYHTIK